MDRRSAHKRMADRLTGGQLDTLLATWRNEGLSLRQIADRLQAEHSVSVTHMTVRSWLNEAGS